MPESFISSPSSCVKRASACRFFCLCSVAAWSQTHTYPLRKYPAVNMQPLEMGKEHPAILTTEKLGIYQNFSLVSLNFRPNWGYIAKVSSNLKQLPKCWMTLSCNVNSALCCLSVISTLLFYWITSCLVLFYRKKIKSHSFSRTHCCSIFQKSKGRCTTASRPTRRLLLLKGGKYPEEWDDEDTKRLSNSKNKSLQRDHPLPCCLVHTCYGCTFKT